MATAWTWNSIGCPFGRIRSLLRFEQLNLIPSCARITSAKLTLFGAGPHPALGKSALSCYPGSPYSSSCPNEVNITRVTQPWIAGVVSWNSQPPTAGPVSVIPSSNVQYNYNPTVDVTQQVQDMVQLGQTSYGFLITLRIEQYYRSMVFFPSSAANPNVRPLLEVSYDASCTCSPCGKRVSITDPVIKSDARTKIEALTE